MLLIRSPLTVLQRNLSALLAMTIWLLHPLNVSTVLYVVQRMAELSALFSLLCMIFYLKGREKYIQTPSIKQLISISLTAFPFLALSFLSKENGVVTLLFIVIIEFTLFQKDKMSNELKTWFGLFIIFPIVILVTYFVFFTPYTNSFIYRGHTQYEHLLTEFRILIDYLSQLFSPNISSMGVIHDDFTVSRGITSPLSTMYSILAIIFLFVLALFFKNKHYVISLGIFWFFAGHSLESTFIPIELYFEHRNYLPSIGIIIAFSYIIILSLSFIQKKSIQTLASITVLLIISLLAFQTFSLTTLWSNTPLQMAISYEKHPSSIRAAHNYAISVKADDPLKAIQIHHDIYQQTNNLNALLLYANSYCNYYKTLPFDENSFLSASSNLRPIGIIYFHLKELSESVLKHQCTSKPAQFLDYLYTSIENNSYLKYRGDDLASIYFVHADIAHSLGDTEGSMLLLNESFQKRATIDILLRQTDLLLMRKKYQAALEHLDKAQNMNNNRKFLQSDRSQEIILKRAFIIKSMNQPT